MITRTLSLLLALSLTGTAADYRLPKLTEAFPFQVLLSQYQQEDYQSHRFGTDEPMETLETTLRTFLGEGWEKGTETPEEISQRQKREARNKVLFKDLPQPKVLGRTFFVNPEFPKVKVHLTLHDEASKEKKFTALLSLVKSL